VVKLFSFWQTDTSLYFLMEYCNGGDMFDYVRHHKTVPELDAARYMFQMARALDFLASKRIIYRDLKLENVLINQSKKYVAFACSSGIAYWKLGWGSSLLVTSVVCGCSLSEASVIEAR
jgi:serine/threonine protein kinase